MKRGLTFWLVLTVSVGLLLTSTFRTFVREAVVIPLLYLLWIGHFIVAAVPHSALWGCYVAILLVIMGGSLLRRRPRKLRTRPPITAAAGRVAGLADLLHQAEHDAYFKWRLAQQLQKLSLDSIAYHTGQSILETRQQLQQGQLDLPAELRAYFEAGLKPLGSLAAPPQRFLTNRPATALDLDPATVVRFLERFHLDQNQAEAEKKYV
ncbi:MAG: hypothetical protein H6631_19790 [Anaerolineaceae bacterium]|nr:hypothetical protein [Anaerolineaceae bacterium]MCB9098541.1 hypothetical protein [Anaerolineales bacterium]